MNDVARRSSLRETAAVWHDRLQRERVSDDVRAEFASWLAEAPEHGAAYQEIERLWCDLKTRTHEPEILALRHETALRLTRAHSKSTRALAWSAAAILLVIVGASLVLLSARDQLPLARLVNTFRGHGEGRYTTATGERLAVTLKDGSELTLNTQTELEVAFTSTERRVNLIRGQAIFEVAKDPGRPFIVAAQRRQFVAVGTAFDVRLDGEQINITMIEGSVRVERATDRGEARAIARPDATRDHAASAQSSAGRTANDLPRGLQRVVTITAGEQLTVDGESPERVRSTDPQRVTSWRRGQIIFENERLIDAIAEINRYSDAKIELADPRLADLRLSGAFATSRPAVFIEAVTSYFPIEVERSDRHAIVLGARQ